MQVYIMTRTATYDSGEAYTWASAHRTKFGALRALYGEMLDCLSRDFDVPDHREEIRQAFKRGDDDESHNAIMELSDGMFYGDIFPDTI